MNQQDGIGDEAFAVKRWSAKRGVMNGDGIKPFTTLELKILDLNGLPLW